MENARKRWSENQKRLQAAIEHRESSAVIVPLFLQQHAQVHAAVVSGCSEPTFEDAVWQDLPASAARSVAPGMLHSIAWMTWHLTRCEDITMNLLAAGSAQVLDFWLEKLGQPYSDTGNSWGAADGETFNQAVDLTALRLYRSAVGTRTREIVCGLPEGAFQQRVFAERAAQLIPMGVVLEEARGLVEYWGSRTIGGLLLMPATRHNMVHWNEAQKAKRKLLPR